MPKKKTSKKPAQKRAAPKKPTGSKADFVRSLPPGLSAKDAIERAKKAGHKLSAAYVYVIRSKGSSKGNGHSKPKRPKQSAGSTGDQAQRFMSLTLDLGLTEAQKLLDRVRNLSA